MHCVFEALNHHAKTRPDAIAFGQVGAEITYHDLYQRVQAMACSLANAGPTVAIALPDGIDYVIADLGATLAGKRVVPLPMFFSNEQLGHVFTDADVDAVVGSVEHVPAQYNQQVFSAYPDDLAEDHIAYGSGATRVIYTSGSSGTPKGVILGDQQLSASLHALCAANMPRETDVHLSVVPYAQLLEQICGIFLPIIAGGRVYISDAADKVMSTGDLSGLVDDFEAQQPTTSLLVPKLLAAWCGGLREKGLMAPSSLRFVAIGGAKTSPDLMQVAQLLHIPLFEGYGLSECCAVVAVNTPNSNTVGSVGKILDCLDVTIEDGEIVVSGPTVMQGYLGGARVNGKWHTGDLGAIQDGRLYYHGRKDALIIRANGRNISPEWIEAYYETVPGVRGACLTHDPVTDDLCLVIVCSSKAAATTMTHPPKDLPTFAQPDHVFVLTGSHPELLLSSGAPNRDAMQAYASAARVKDVELVE